MNMTNERLAQLLSEGRGVFPAGEGPLFLTDDGSLLDNTGAMLLPPDPARAAIAAGFAGFSVYTLPVAGSWDAGKVNSYPCRFWGTVYDGSLIVGGADQPGQFAGFDRIFDGSAVTVTDMTGAEFSYVVDRVERSKSAQAEVLMAGEADLTLFARDAYSLEYVILRCVEEAAYLG